MARDIWCLRNAVDMAALTASPVSVAALGPGRLQDPRVGVVWRPSASGTELTINLAETETIDVFAVFGISSLEDLTFELSLAGGAWSPQIDPIARAAFWIAERDAGSAPSVSSISLTVNGAAPDIGRIWAGPAHWRPTVNHVAGAAQNVVDYGSVERAARSGAVFTDSARRLRRHVVQYEALELSEWDGPAWDLDMLAGTTKQLLFIPDHEYYPPERHAILGYQEALSPIEQIIWRRARRSYTMMEAG